MQRAIIRNMAKERMRAMDIQHVNKAMSRGGHVTHTKEQNNQRTMRGRIRMIFQKGKKLPLWRRIMFGDLAIRGLQAFNKKAGVKAWR